MSRIKVKMLTEKAYATLQSEYKEVYEQICLHPYDSSWLADYLKFQPYEEKTYEIDDFTLKINANYSEVAFSNAVTLYEALKDLPKYILSNQRFWGWIIFEKAYIPAQQNVKLEDADIVKNFWFSRQNRREIMLNAIGREFYKVLVSVDETLPNKYELTEYIVKNFGLYQNMIYRNLGMLKNLTIPLIRIEKEYFERTESHVSKTKSSALFKEATKISSVMLIDSMDSSEIEAILRRKAPSIIG